MEDGARPGLPLLMMKILYGMEDLKWMEANGIMAQMLIEGV